MTRGGLRAFVPGMLVAATGVGAGDLATSALAGSATGVALLWAIVLGCAMKFLLTEGIARCQLAAGESVLHAALRRVPRALGVVLAAYFVAWMFLVAAALMSASGVVLHACAPLLADPVHDKILYGAAASLAGLWLVRRGGFAWFERAMAACTAAMAFAVVGCAIALAPDWSAVLRGLFVPAVPGGEGASWAIALIGGIGGTVTMLCYGYWIAAKGRTGPEDLPLCRLDLAAAYAMTALFGIGMVVVGSGLHFSGEGGGATLAVLLADQLGGVLGSFGRATFLLGAATAVFSSLIGVWHSVPLLVADGVLGPGGSGRDLTATGVYRTAQVLLATVPMLGLVLGFARLQKTYAIVGALFTPMLATALLVLLRDPKLGTARIGPAHVGLLVMVALFFAFELVHSLVP